MGSLYALASHVAGDFILQTDRMAERKFDDRLVRVEHCLVYCLAFIPFVVWMPWGYYSTLTFLVLLFSTHVLIDSRRWNDDVPIWYDQALHVIALALSVGVTQVIV